MVGPYILIHIQSMEQWEKARELFWACSVRLGWACACGGGVRALYVSRTVAMRCCERRIRRMEVWVVLHIREVPEEIIISPLDL